MRIVFFIMLNTCATTFLLSSTDIFDIPFDISDDIPVFYIPKNETTSFKQQKITVELIINDLSNGRNSLYQDIYLNKSCIRIIDKAIEDIKKINPTLHPSFIGLYEALVPKDIRVFDQAYITSALSTIDPENYPLFIESCQKIIPNKFIVNGITNVTSALSTIDPENYPRFVEFCQKLISDEFMGNNVARIVLPLSKINPENYPLFIESCKKFITKKMCVYDIENMILVMSEVNPLNYTEKFFNICQMFIEEGWDGPYVSRIIEDISKVDSSKYTDIFVRTCFSLMDRQKGDGFCVRSVIQSLGKIDISKYTNSFIQTCQTFITPDMNDFIRSRIIDSISQIDDASYEYFVQVCKNIATEEMNDRDKINILEAVSIIPETLWPSIKIFMDENLFFFNCVPTEPFLNTIRDHHPKTENELYSILNTIQRAYRNGDPDIVNRGIAFEIHDYSNQIISSPSGKTGRFNEVVLNHVNECIAEKQKLLYEEAIHQMRTIFLILKTEEPQGYSDSFFNWAIECISENAYDKDVCISIVTYLQDNDFFRTWLQGFLSESEHAYTVRKNSHEESCIKGVQERLISSLRGINEPCFQDIFNQAETKKLLTIKKTSLNDNIFWAKQLFNADIRSTTSVQEAKKTYEKVLQTFFSDVLIPESKDDIEDTIHEMMELFSDDSGDGLWRSKLFPAIKNLEKLL